MKNIALEIPAEINISKMLSSISNEQMDMMETAEQIVSKLDSMGAEVVKFIQKQYPELITALRATGELYCLAKERGEMAVKQMEIISRQYMEQNNQNSSLSPMEKTTLLTQSYSKAKEIVTKEILLAPL